MRGLFIFVSALLVLQASAGFVDTIRTATLSGDQVVPQGSASTAVGTCVCVLNRNVDPILLDCEIQHTSSASMTGVILGLGSRNKVVRTAYSFDSSNFNFNVRQVFSMVDLTDESTTYTVASQVEDFLNGQWYVEIFTDDFPFGDVRGQLEHNDRAYIRLDARNTIPRASGTTSTGLALSVYNFLEPMRELAFDIVHDITSPIGTQMRFGRPGEVGPILYSFSESSVVPIIHEIELTIGEEDDFFEDLTYLQILSEENPSGEIRGQIVTIDYIPEVAFTSRMDGNQEVPSVATNARGCGLVAYDCETRIFEYVVVHNVNSPIGAFVQAGEPGQAGLALFSLARHESPIYGAIQLTLQEEFALYSQELYFNILSTSVSSGEVRGQIDIEHEFWAYISGSNVVSPVTTAAMGCATFKLKGQNSRNLDFDIMHSVSSPVSASFHIGPEGANSAVANTVFESSISPIRGDGLILDDDELEAFVTDNTYVIVTSAREPFLGEVRGQIKRIAPCTVDRDNSLTIGDGSFNYGSYYLSYGSGNTYDSSGKIPRPETPYDFPTYDDDDDDENTTDDEDDNGDDDNGDDDNVDDDNTGPYVRTNGGQLRPGGTYSTLSFSRRFIAPTPLQDTDSSTASIMRPFIAVALAFVLCLVI